MTIARGFGFCSHGWCAQNHLGGAHVKGLPQVPGWQDELRAE